MRQNHYFPILIQVSNYSTALENVTCVGEDPKLSSNGAAESQENPPEPVDNSSIASSTLNDNDTTAAAALIPVTKKEVAAAPSHSGVDHGINHQHRLPAGSISNGKPSRVALHVPAKEVTTGSNKISNGSGGLNAPLSTPAPPPPPPGVHQQQQEMFDSDGLIAYRDEMNDRIAEIVRTHKMEMEYMHQDLKITRKRLIEVQREKEGGGGILDGPPGTSSSASEFHLVENGMMARKEVSSSTNGSMTSNSSSWEAFEENEASATLWVPDHSTDVCMR